MVQRIVFVFDAVTVLEGGTTVLVLVLVLVGVGLTARSEKGFFLFEDDESLLD